MKLFSSNYFNTSGLGGPPWQYWEPRLPALRVGVNDQLSLTI